MKKVILTLAILINGIIGFSGGYEVGDKATDFELLNIDGTFVSLADFDEAEGFVVIFTCNHCPYAVAYEDRIIDIDKKYKDKGYPVIAINPNDPKVSTGDSYDAMITRSKEKGFTFPYLIDKGQKIYPQYGATRTPHVYLLQKENKDLIVKYIGTIDNNYADESKVTETYLTDAIDALIEGKSPEPNFTKAIGCTIKVKK